MIKLDKTKVYDFGKLKDGLLVELVYHLKNNFSNFQRLCMEDMKSGMSNGFIFLGFNNNSKEWMLSSINAGHKNTTNAIELFYTLENVQVDCRELSKDQINNMVKVLSSHSKEPAGDNALDIDDFFTYLQVDEDYFIIYESEEKKHTITYDKFIELFGDKTELPRYTQLENGKIVPCETSQTLHIQKTGRGNRRKLDNKTDKLSAFILMDFGAEKDKPSQYQIGIDTFERMESNFTVEERIAFAKGNIDKYNWRVKGQDVEDFKKIIAYAEWAIKQLQ